MTPVGEAIRLLKEHLELVKDQIPEGWEASVNMEDCRNCGRPILKIKFRNGLGFFVGVLSVAHADPVTGMFMDFEAVLNKTKTVTLPAAFAQVAKGPEFSLGMILLGVPGSETAVFVPWIDMFP